MQAETPQAADRTSSSAMEQSAAAQPGPQAADQLMTALLDRIGALEEHASSHQVAIGTH